MFKVSNKNIRTTLLWRRSDVVIVTFEHISHLFLVSIVDFEQVS